MRRHVVHREINPADRRFAEPDRYRYFWKPPAVTFGFGAPAILLIVLQMWFPALDRALGSPVGDSVGLLRLLAVFVGAFLLSVAVPLYKPADWTPEQEQEQEAAREYFRGKRGI